MTADVTLAGIYRAIVSNTLQVGLVLLSGTFLCVKNPLMRGQDAVMALRGGPSHRRRSALCAAERVARPRAGAVREGWQTAFRANINGDSVA